MYSERFLDHFRNPRNAGELPPPAHTIEISNPACGDILHISARWEGDSIADARYQIRGCTASIVAGSALAEWLPGKTRAQLSALTVEHIETASGGLTPETRHAAVLCIHAVKKLLRG